MVKKLFVQYLLLLVAITIGFASTAPAWGQSTWTRVAAMRSGLDSRLAMSQAESKLYVSTYSTDHAERIQSPRRTLVSSDNGATWTTSTIRGTVTNIVSTNIGLFAHGTNEGAAIAQHTSTDGGATWTSRTFSIDDRSLNIVKIRPNYSISIGDRIVMSGYANAEETINMMYSTNLGSTWTAATGLPGRTSAVGLIKVGARLFCTLIPNNTSYPALSQALYSSNDNGTTWLPYSVPTLPTVPSGGNYEARNYVYPYLFTNNTVTILTLDNIGGSSEHYRSTDGGASWMRMAMPMGRFYMIQAGTNLIARVHPHGSGNLISRDNGLTWTAFPLAPPTTMSFINQNVTTGDYLFSTTSDSVYRISISQFLNPPPSITSFTPSSGAPGASVIITGMNFTGATAVSIGGVAVSSFTVNSATQITAIVPAGVVDGVISVTASGVTGSSVQRFSVIPPPSITSFTPTNGAPGASVVITGRNFTDASNVRIGGISTTFSVNSATQITAIVPPGVREGVISITTPGGTATSSERFTLPLLPVPTITSFSPSSGVAGDRITLTGTGFRNVIEEGVVQSVSIGGVDAPLFGVQSNTQMAVVVPSGARTGRMVVTTPAGSATSSEVFTVNVPMPTISSFTPRSALVGAVITIMGTNFTGTTAVSFGTTPAASFTVVSATQITAVVPSGVSSGALSVVTPSGRATSSTTFALLIPPPRITDFTPTSGRPGASISITGQNFMGASSVSFGAAPAASFTVSADGRTITASVGTGASGLVSVVTPNGWTSSSATFTYLPPVPSITSIMPTSIRAGEASTLTIQGTNLTNARVGGTDNAGSTLTPTLLSNTATIVTFSITPSSAGLATFTLSTPGGSAIAPSVMVLSPRPFITGFSPTRARTGDVITITGTNLDAASAITLGGTPASIVAGSNTNTRVQVTVGAGTSGAAQLTTSGGTASAGASFTFDASARPPVITDFSPASGPVGTRVTITGTGFTRDGLNIGIGSFAWHEIVSVTPTEIVFIVRADAGGQTGRIQIWSSAGFAQSAGNFTCTIPTTLDAPTPTAPANGTVLTSTTSYISVPFSWSAVLGAAAYSLQTSLDTSFSTAPQAYTYSETVAGTTINSFIYAPRSGQPPSVKYWRVRALNGSVQSPWSATQRVLATPPARILSVSPAEMQQGVSVTLTIRGESTDFTRSSGVRLVRGTTTISGTILPGAMPTQLLAAFSVPNDAAVGMYSLSLTGASPLSITLPNSISITSSTGEPDVPITTAFDPLIHGFGFCNCESNIWPRSVWSAIDYTSSAFPAAIRSAALLGQIRADVFPSFDDYAAISDLTAISGGYPSFYTDGSRYPGSSPSAVSPLYINLWLRLATNLGTFGGWQGSCGGMSQVSLLNFVGSAPYQFSGTSYSFAPSLTNDNLRKLINRHQNEQGYYRGASVNETLAQLREDLASGDRMRHRIIGIFPRPDASGAAIGHAVIPTSITTTRNAIGEVIDRIALYDVNIPGGLSQYIEVNRTLGTWSYPSYGPLWQGTTGFQYTRTVAEIIPFSSRPGPILTESTMPSFVVSFSTPFRSVSGTQLTPFVRLTNALGGSIATSGTDADKPSIPDATLNQSAGGLPPNFSSFVTGFTLPNRAGSEAFTLQYSPVVSDQLNRITATAAAGFFSAEWLAFSTTQSQSLQMNLQESTMNLSSPVALSGVNATFIVSAAAAKQNAFRIVNTSLAAGDTLATSVENKATTLVLNSTATPRVYDLQLARDTTILTFPRISMGADEQHQIRAAQWDNLRTSPIYLIISKRGAAAQGVQPQVLQLNPNAGDPTSVRVASLPISTMRVFPNPASALVSVEASVSAASTLRLQLVNILGQVLWSREETVQAGAYRTEIDMANFHAGVYIVRIATGEHYQTARIVKP